MWFQRMKRFGAAVNTAALLCVLGEAFAQAQQQDQKETPVQVAQAQTLQARPQPAAQDPMSVAINQRLQDALRERDAIIRNLLERVQELEWRVNGGFTTSPKDMLAINPASASAPTATRVGAAASVTSVVTNAGYDSEERQASQALDQALIVRGGLLLPSGTIEIDNSTSY